MHTLIVATHPDETSLTRHVVDRLITGLAPLSTAVADLTAEKFDPRFTLDDHLAYNGARGLPADVLDEQQRLARAQHLVVVFPVYWWSMPAQLKGWFDRVFADGFAYSRSTGGITPALQWLTMHFVPIAATRAEPFARRGYESALRTQLEHGIVDYCGGVRGTFALINDSQGTAPLAMADDAVRQVIDKIRTDPRALGEA
ncbi:NAD(P)H-dependent oxidoreductase [Polymorphospora lycopeni]|uniref:NAD(P)H-dependent oxidoreductase n=1 Tax=Polymorphospora lycopeni TaxID=3140240 RepID=A0ABV5CKD8_9ACTN